MGWATAAEVKTDCGAITKGAAASLPSDWDPIVNTQVEYVKARIMAALGLRGYSDWTAIAAGWAGLNGLHKDLAAYEVLSRMLSLDERAAVNLDRLNRWEELDIVIPVDSNGAVIGGGEGFGSRDLPEHTHTDRTKVFGRPEDITW